LNDRTTRFVYSFYDRRERRWTKDTWSRQFITRGEKGDIIFFKRESTPGDKRSSADMNPRKREDVDLTRRMDQGAPSSLFVSREA
jgi:hypothetical protein